MAPEMPSEPWTEPSQLSHERKAILARLAELFERNPRTTAEKLDQFPKYVPMTAVGRLLARYEMFKLVQNIPGAFIEAGVLSGAGLFAFVQFAFLLDPHNTYRKLIGFDTFSGFPSLSDVDTRGTSAHMVVGGFADDSYEELRALAAVHEDFRMLRQRSQIELVKGNISETVPAYLASHPELVVALLYLDADLFEPTKVCLEYFLPRMPKGSVIVFDELGLADYPGETAAVLESLQLNRLALRKLPFIKASYAIVE